jgi:hypothetical protein
MNLEKWQDIKSKVLDNFEVIDKYEEEDNDLHGKKEIIEFNGPLGKIKLVFSIRDLIIDKHTNYSNRIGSNISVDYKYSDTEKTCSLKAFKFVSEDWEEIEIPF